MIMIRCAALLLFCLSFRSLAEVTAPPPRLKLDSFYTKHIDSEGFSIVASGKVSDYALEEAAYLFNMMLAKRPDVRRAMIANGSYMVVLAYDQFVTDMPEFRHFVPKDYWDARARGLGGSETDPVSCVAEENLLAFPGDPYFEESIFIHEVAHQIHLRGLVDVDKTWDARVKAAYASAMKKGLWAKKYASVNHHEYFAEGVQSWFDDNRPPDHDHNHVNTRKELKVYDPGLAALCQEAFGETELVYTKPGTRLQGHLEGYEPRKAPRFAWPARLKAAQKRIQEEVKRRK